MSLVLSHSASSISAVILQRVMKVTTMQAAPPTEMATMLPVSMGSSSPVFLTKVAAERPPGKVEAYDREAASDHSTHQAVGCGSGPEDGHGDGDDGGGD